MAAGSDLFVGGDFTQAGGRLSYHLARWDTTTPASGPLLTISNFVDYVVIEWPAQSPAGVLETSPTMKTGIGWLPLEPVESAGTFRYTHRTELGSPFFRLR